MTLCCAWRASAVFCVTACLIAPILLWPIAVGAQDFNRIAPKQPAQTRPGRITAGPAADAAPQTATADDGKVILQSLKGLRLVSRAADVVKSGAVRSGVHVAAVPGLNDPAFKAELEHYIGNPLTFGDLHAIVQTTVAYLRAHHRPLADVAVPEQDVTSGTVQLVVTEFKLGRVKVRGNRWFSSAIIRQGIEAQSGRTPDLDQLKRDLDWLNRNPFRKVDAVFARGKAVGTTDIQLTVQDRFPLRLYLAYDNTGAPVTGRSRWSAGVNFGNLFASDQQLSYQFSASDDFIHHVTDGKAHFMAHSLTYMAPLPWQDIVEVFGSYVLQRPDVGPFFGQVGHFWQGSARYIHEFGGPAWLSHELQFGFDYKTTDNNLAFGGVQVFSASQDIDQLLLTYNATAIDSWGVTTLENDLVLSPGGITTNNTDAAFALSGTSFAKARYAYDTLSLSRVTQLPYNSSWVMRLKVQAASGDLLPSEQLGGGGEGSVRGYDTRVVNGSQGGVLSQELRSPPFSLLDWAIRKSTSDNAQLFVFWDYAHLSDPHTQPSFPDHFALESAGVGFNYLFGRTLDLRADYGRQLLALPGASKRGSQLNLAITLSY